MRRPYKSGRATGAAVDPDPMPVPVRVWRRTEVVQRAAGLLHLPSVAMLLALGSALVYGVSDYVGGRASRRSAPVVVALLAEVSLLALMLVVVPLVERSAPSDAAVWWGVAGGLAGSAGVLGLYVALARGNMTVVAPITGVVAAALPVIVGVALGERPGGLAAVGILAALIAVLLIGGIVGASHVEVSTVLLAAVVGAAFGMLFVAYSRTGDDAGLWPLLSARFGATPLLIVAFVVMRRRGQSVRFERSAVGPGVIIGVLIGLANGLYLLAARRGMLSVVAVLVALYPASTVALASVLDGERASRSQSVGMVLAVAAVTMITVGA
jgi:drug/metabolite transporter (DMT)-like permease